MPGTGDIEPPSSVCPIVTFSFHSVIRTRITVFSRNFAGVCTMSWGGGGAEEKIVFFVFHAISNIFII